MRVDDFDFNLPSELIAQHPPEQRDGARLLHVFGGALADKTIHDLPDLLRSGDLLVLNNTRVLPSRLIGKRGDATNPGKPETVTVELTLHKQEPTIGVYPTVWKAFAKPARKVSPRDHIVFAPGFACDVLAKGVPPFEHGGEVTLGFRMTPDQMIEKLKTHGAMPLPPYIKRDGDDSAPEDEDRYQTVYAAHDGAVAAPTAGLHFTDDLFDRLAAKGISKTFITLHVGAGTFLPVVADDTEDHIMHTEYAEISTEAAQAINTARAAGGRIVCVGTTALRTLESAVSDDSTVPVYGGDTNLFITPGYTFKACDVLLTNFHLPKSTLFMLVSAFSGLETMKTAYAHAVSEKYRFFSYGDACLLEPNS